MDRISVAQDTRDTASRVRFDLDLPSAAHDDIPCKAASCCPSGTGRSRLKRDMCSLTCSTRQRPALRAAPHLLRPARRLRHQFEALTPARRWLKNQPEGPELDIDACVRAFADRRTGHAAGSDGGYLSCERRERDLCCLVLADLSLSTDTWVSDEQRVIDVIRDSLWLFSEALGATGDPFGLYGFSSRKREHIRFHRIKGFDEKPTTASAAASARSSRASTPASARPSATPRRSSPSARRPCAADDPVRWQAQRRGSLRRPLRHRGHPDEPQRRPPGGVRPFCVTIDKEGQGYLPHLFGPSGYTILRNPAELPARLPGLYAQLTAG
jgi:nitric oxide reductase NorD protein